VRPPACDDAFHVALADDAEQIAPATVDVFEADLFGWAGRIQS
jgi:hypothetical protein